MDEKRTTRIAKKLEVAPQVVSNWKRRKKIPTKAIKPLAKILKVKSDFILDHIE